MSYQNETSPDDHILNAAERLLLSDVGDAFTMEQLVAETQLSRATIYRRVGNKEALLRKLAAERDIPISDLEQPDMRTRILEAARQVFGRFGMIRSTMDQIAQEAGVGVATVYRHFGDKNSLLIAFSDSISPGKVITQLNYYPGCDLRADLTRVVLEIIQFFTQNQDMVRISFEEHAETRQMLHEMRQNQTRTLYIIHDYLAHHIEAGILLKDDPYKMAASLLGMIVSFTILMPMLYNMSMGKPEEMAQFIIKLFLDGVAA
jgi:AcrR family transcriptional regulator